MSSGPIADKHRRLADALEAARAEGVEVDAVESYTVDGELVATVDVGVGEQTERPDQSTADDVVDGDANAADPENEPEPSTPAESDIAPGDVQAEQEHEDADVEEEEQDWGPPAIATDDANEEAVDADVEDAEMDEATTESDQDGVDTPDGVAGEVLAALREEGECTPGELEMITGVSDAYYALGKLEDDDLIEKRKDPDDGRRTLYSAADWLVEDEDGQDEEPEWNGRDPETIVADSSLPARVVLDDILDTVPTADTVIDLAEQLDVDVDNLGPVCWHLTLKQADSLAIVSDVDERVETIREVVSA